MPATAKIVSKVGLIFPKYKNPPSYLAFLNDLLEIPGNRRAFVVTEKSTVDAQYDRLLKEHTGVDDAAYWKHINEAGHEHPDDSHRP